MPVDDLHRRVAAVALEVARWHGFALGGGERADRSRHRQPDH
jgi:hypothetical protein